MWISRVAFDALNAERIAALKEARVLREQNTSLRITLDWFRHQLEQVGHERAILLKTYMGVSVPVPKFVHEESTEEDIIGGSSLFNDIGDDAAKRLGIEWDGEGIARKQ